MTQAEAEQAARDLIEEIRQDANEAHAMLKAGGFPDLDYAESVEREINETLRPKLEALAADYDLNLEDLT